MFVSSMYCQSGGIGYPRHGNLVDLHDNYIFLVFADEHET